MSLEGRKLALDDVIENLKADIKELYDRMGNACAYLEVDVLNIMEFEERTKKDASIKHDRR